MLTQPLDYLSARKDLTSALSQFLGLTGAGIPIDIIKIDKDHLWIRTQSKDMTAVAAAIGGWIDDDRAWKVRGASKWLGHLVVGSRERLFD